MSTLFVFFKTGASLERPGTEAPAARATGHVPPCALLLVLLLALLGACRPAPTPRPGLTDYRVRSVGFEGANSIDANELREALATQRNSFNPFAPISYYNRFELVADIERIQTFYADRGYFDARVVDYEVELEEGRKNSARIRFIIEEGYQSSLAQDAQFDLESLRTIEQSGVLFSQTPLRQGTPFNRALIERERERIRRELMERSYARARVEARVYVNRESYTARVYFFFDPGVACRFGDLEIVGNHYIPDELIRRNIRIEPNDVYRHSLLRRSQVELYDLDAFTSVEIEAFVGGQSARLPLRSFQEVDAELYAQGFELLDEVFDPMISEGVRVASLLDNIDEIHSADPQVPIRITVTESPAATYKFGGGLAIESARAEAYGRTNAIWRNVLSPLNRAEVEGRLGYAWVPALFGGETLATGLVGEVGASISRPRVVFGIFDAALRIGFVRGIETDHAYSRPRARLSIENRIGEFMRFQMGYQFELNFTKDFAESPTPVSSPARGSCDTLPRTFRLGYVDASFHRERRDPNFALGSNDWAASISAQVGEPFLGDYNWYRLDPEIRYYRELTRRISIATRASAGVIFDPDDSVPRSQCLTLGGGSSVRGFSDRRIGPHIEPDIPTGGIVSYLLNVETRIKLSGLFGLVVFADLGEVNNRMAFDPAWGGATGINASVGSGLRIFTPIGPVRADIGVRISPVPEEHGRIPRWNFVVSLGEAF